MIDTLIGVTRSKCKPIQNNSNNQQEINFFKVGHHYSSKDVKQ